MKKLTFCLAIAIVAIACLFSAGCIGTSETNDFGTSSLTENHEKDFSQEEKEYKEALRILNNPAGYTIEKSYFDSFTYSEHRLAYLLKKEGDDIAVKSLGVHYDSLYEISDDVIACSYITKDINDLGYFLIKDDSISRSYTITITKPAEGLNMVDKYPYMVYLTSNDYEQFVNLIKEVKEARK